jgi:hypothetical protein
MSALDSQIVVDRLRQQHGIPHNRQADRVEAAETIERLQMAENILQKLLSNPRGVSMTTHGTRFWLESGTHLTPEEFTYLEKLSQFAIPR